jgi:pilus assembly protein Flp/PilA
MNMTATKEMLASFAREEDGSQVIEYALIIAVVSIALALGLKALATGTTFSDLITRVDNCLKAGGTCS